MSAVLGALHRGTCARRTTLASVSPYPNRVISCLRSIICVHRSVRTSFAEKPDGVWKEREKLYVVILVQIMLRLGFFSCGLFLYFQFFGVLSAPRKFALGGIKCV